MAPIMRWDEHGGAESLAKLVEESPRDMTAPRALQEFGACLTAGCRTSSITAGIRSMPRRVIAVALLACYLPACTSWRVERGVSLAQVMAVRQPDVIRVTGTDGRRFVLAPLRIVAGDSLEVLNGLMWRRFVLKRPSIVVADSLAALYPEIRARVALADIGQVETQQYDQGKTLLLGVVGAGVVLVFFGLLVQDAFGNLGVGLGWGGQRAMPLQP